MPTFYLPCLLLEYRRRVGSEKGETMAVDFRNFVPDQAVPVKITVSVAERTNEYATVHIVRKYVR